MAFEVREFEFDQE